MMKHIMLIAGEASGDRHGANLMNALKGIDPSIRFTGLGGPLMHEAGQEQLYDIRRLAVLGLTEVLKNIFFFKRVFKETLDFAMDQRPDALILVDYPGFNVRLAEGAYKEKIKIVYYISPQVWAWGKNRVRRLGKVIEKMLVVFPFEEEIYSKENIPVSFVGHPLLDELKDVPSKEDARKSFLLNLSDIVIGVLPGSRLQEIKLILPVMLRVALLLRERFNARFLLPLAPLVKREFIEREIKKIIPSANKGYDFLKIVEGESARVISASDLVITASGTATLETGILQRPMVIVYKVPLLSYVVLRRLIKVPYIGMVNILLKEEAFPEFIQYRARPSDIFKVCARILEDKNYHKDMMENLKKLQAFLGGTGGGMMAAEEVWRIMYGNSQKN